MARFSWILLLFSVALLGLVSLSFIRHKPPTDNSSPKKSFPTPTLASRSAIPYGWKTYTNNNYGFAISYPASLKPSLTFTRYHNLTDSWSVLSDTSSNGIPLFTIPIFRVDNSPSYPRYYSAELRIGASSTSAELKNCTEHTSGQKTINGIPFAMLSLDNAAMMQYIAGTSYRVMHNGYCFAIEQIRTGSNYRDEPSPSDIPEPTLTGYYDQIMAIINTFTFQ